MSNAAKPSPIVVLAGVISGVATYIGVCVTSGSAIVPTVESVTNVAHGMSEPNREVSYIAKAPAVSGGAGGAYATVCQSCHQADGKGMPGAFPPLVGSSWVTGDPETPVRIVLLGLSGEIEVNGTKFNAVMPPPAGITDEQIAEAVSHARTSWGNSASKVDAAFVKQVRDSLAGRTNPWTAAELLALRPAGGGAAPAAPEGAAPEGAAPEGAAPEGAAPEGAPTEAPAAPAPAAPEGAAAQPN